MIKVKMSRRFALRKAFRKARMKKVVLDPKVLEAIFLEQNASSEQLFKKAEKIAHQLNSRAKSIEDPQLRMSAQQRRFG